LYQLSKNLITNDIILDGHDPEMGVVELTLELYIPFRNWQLAIPLNIVCPTTSLTGKGVGQYFTGSS
jgi:hypothetical protein